MLKETVITLPTIKINPGDLPILLTWQSLDGRICIEYPDDMHIATSRYLYLVSLGTVPKLWLDITDNREDIIQQLYPV